MKRNTTQLTHPSQRHPAQDALLALSYTESGIKNGSALDISPKQLEGIQFYRFLSGSSNRRRSSIMLGGALSKEGLFSRILKNFGTKGKQRKVLPDSKTDAIHMRDMTALSTANPEIQKQLREQKETSQRQRNCSARPCDTSVTSKVPIWYFQA